MAIAAIAAYVGVAPAASATAPEADLSVSVSHVPGSPLTGDDLTFTITASNAGPDPATSTVVGMSFQYPFSFTSATATGGTCAPVAESSSIICTLGDLASGGSGTATIVVTPLLAGVYTVPVAVASDTDDPDTTNDSATDTVIVQQGPTTYDRAVAAIYQQVLGRPPSASEETFWGDRWASGAYRFAANSVPLAIISSDEARSIRIRADYGRILGRAPAAPEVAYWLGRMAHGLTFEAFEINLVASPEFRAPVADQVDQAITNVFHAILHRPPSAAELAFSEAHLPAHAPLAALAAKLQYSNEGRNRVIDQRFAQVLHRAPLPLDRYIWRLNLLHGSTADQEWSKLYASGEFLQQFPQVYPPFPADATAATHFSAAPLAHLAAG